MHAHECINDWKNFRQYTQIKASRGANVCQSRKLQFDFSWAYNNARTALHNFKFSRGHTPNPHRGRGRPHPEPTPTDDLRRFAPSRRPAPLCAGDCWTHTLGLDWNPRNEKNLDTGWLRKKRKRVRFDQGWTRLMIDLSKFEQASTFNLLIIWAHFTH